MRRSALWSRKRDWRMLALQADIASYARKPVKAFSMPRHRDDWRRTEPIGVPSTAMQGPLNTPPQPRTIARNLVSACVFVYELSRGLHGEASWRAERLGPIRI